MRTGCARCFCFFLSVVFRDLFLIVTHYFMRHSPVLPALLKLSITLVSVCCLGASLALCVALFVVCLVLIVFNKHSRLVEGRSLQDRAGSKAISSPTEPAEPACTAAGLRSKLEGLARAACRAGAGPAAAQPVPISSSCGEHELGWSQPLCTHWHCPQP